MTAESPFGWIRPRTEDRGLSWARAKAGETLAAHGTGAVVREVLRTELAAYARDLTRQEIDGALEWAARRLAHLREQEAGIAEPLRAFEVRIRAVLGTAPATRCADARRALLAEDHRLSPEQALALIARVAPPCITCAPPPRTVSDPRAATRRLDS